MEQKMASINGSIPVINRVTYLVIIYNLAQSVQRIAYEPVGLGVGFRFTARARDFSLLHNVQSGSGAHPTFYTIYVRIICIYVLLILYLKEKMLKIPFIPDSLKAREAYCQNSSTF
jgi:hypothetical protein